MQNILPFLFERQKAHPPELLYSQKVKLKKLSGFQNGKHFLPKYYSRSLEEFIGNISLKDIEEYMAAPVEALRELLQLKVNDYSYEISSTEGGIFDCPEICYEVKYSADRENLTDAWLNASVVLKTLSEEGHYRWERIMNCFPFQFSTVNMPFAIPLDLRSFIEQFEQFYPWGSREISYRYDSAVNFIEIIHPQSGKNITLDTEGLRITFTNQFTLTDFLTLWRPATV